MPYFSGPNGIREVADPGERFLQSFQDSRRKRLLSDYFATGNTDMRQLGRLDPEAASNIQADQKQKGLAQMFADLYTAPEEERPKGLAAMLGVDLKTGMEAVRAFDPRYGRGQGEQFTLSPGSKRFGPDGRVVAEVPFAPASAQLVNVPDGNGGTIQYEFDPRTRQFGIPQYPGQGQAQPNAPGGVAIQYDGPPEGRAAFEAAIRQDQALGSPPGDYTITQPFAGGRMGYVPPKPAGGADAPSGYQWNPDGSQSPIPGGPADRRNNPTPVDQAKGEMGMRKELQDLIKQDRSVLTMYQNVQNAAKAGTAASDLSMIFAYMKMLDPASVVREQEFANAQNAAGIPDRVLNVRNQILSGNRLNPKQRLEFQNEARQLAAEAQGRITSSTREHQGIAEQYGYDTVRATGQADFRNVQAGGGSISEGNRGGTKYRVGQVIEAGGKRYRVTGGDMADPDVEEVR